MCGWCGEMSSPRASAFALRRRLCGAVPACLACLHPACQCPLLV